MTLDTLSIYSLSEPAAALSLASHVCPSCGKEKRGGRSFCGGCWNKLRSKSVSAARALFTGKPDALYVVALRAAFQWLGVREFTVPVKSKPPAPAPVC